MVPAALRKAALQQIERENIKAEKEYSDKEEVIKYSEKYLAKEQVIDNGAGVGF